MQSLVDVCVSASRRRSENETAKTFFSASLRALRAHLGMEVAFVSHFANGRRYFRHLDSSPGAIVPSVGASDELEDPFCLRVIDGRLPEIIRDAETHEEAMKLPATRRYRVKSHISVPIRLFEGTIYGTLCCFSSRANHELDDRDLDVMRTFADVMAEHVERDLAEHAQMEEAMRRIKRIIQSNDLHIVYQPIVNVAQGVVVGFEALTRFDLTPPRSPDAWFAEATRVGLGVDLETHCIKEALRALEHLPVEQYISLNASPATIISGSLRQVLHGVPPRRVVIEVTEHAVVEHYGELLEAFQPMQEAGIRFAIDDAGAGYASFRHILNLSPHMIKLDVSITRGIDVDRSRRALAVALSGFARETNCRLVAEGVETAAEWEVLRQIGFSKAQGYFLGRPMPLDQAVRFVLSTADRPTS